jgi:hypothetical protein
MLTTDKVASLAVRRSRTAYGLVSREIVETLASMGIDPEQVSSPWLATLTA